MHHPFHQPFHPRAPSRFARLLRPLAILLAALLLAFAPGVRTAAAQLDVPATALPTSDDSRLQVRSETSDDLLQAEVEALLPYSFTEVATILSHPANWCEIAPLSLNIKACTWQESESEALLALYAGGKAFHPPEDAHRLDYRFHLAENSSERLWLFLFAAEGPMGTSDFRIELEALPAGPKTRLRIASSFRSGLFSRIALRSYLATLGRDKVGFSLVQDAADAAPVPARGLRGMIERNAMRYYLALRAFFETRHLPAHKRYAASLDTWYDLTERFPRQLRELEKDEYLEAKLKEREHQVRLQEALEKTVGLDGAVEVSAVVE